MAKGRITPVNEDLRQKRRNETAARQCIVEFLLDQIAHHAFTLGVEHVERIAGLLGPDGSLQSQQPDLRAIAMCDHKLMSRLEKRKECGNRAPDIGALGLGRHRLTAPQQGVAPQRDDDPHRPQAPSVATSIALIVCIRFSA